MIFGLFSNPKPTPLTTACMKMSAPENLREFAKHMIERQAEMVRIQQERDYKAQGMDERAIMLHSVIMSAAGLFIGGLQWEPTMGSEASQRYLRNTNLDVITAEAIIWIDFLMGWFIDNEAKKQRSEESFEEPIILVLLGDTTWPEARLLTLGTMKKFTGFDFKATKYFAERYRYYREAAKDGLSFEPFATIVLKSVGRQSPADPLQNIGPLPPPEWTPLSLNVLTFFGTMPPKYYETFKNMLEEWSASETERIIASQRAMAGRAK